MNCEPDRGRITAYLYMTLKASLQGGVVSNVLFQTS
jgi:hypothetical protein